MYVHFSSSRDGKSDIKFEFSQVVHGPSVLPNDSRRQSTRKYLFPSCITTRSSGDDDEHSRPNNLNSTDPSSRTSVRLASRVAKASCSIKNSPLDFSITTFSYISRILLRNSIGWKWVPRVNRPCGWGHFGEIAKVGTRLFAQGGSSFCGDGSRVCLTPSEQYPRLWFSGAPDGPGYIIVQQRLHVAGRRALFCKMVSSDLAPTKTQTITHFQVRSARFGFP